ncbi:MAG: 3-deoxy-D-manno-octulosonic acid transferase [Verrucomicrobia bacterium CG_4_10_14_3_um_filter_43_23]|nr:MAG: hypothetical protein AUJ82_06445 [Verrucomicrobia bacterium CG1_02_43_26]PIP58890.1 MAG: 3-deoxy-D-manno-octulosonic acid transferase [Verrucomicrobia bacterium CG22_combo_CG10-13_8_21_14_all_43_17]PIX58727.1 MAG: 3-deoxy-D-manno-octulosonic acid transferase [Verrucomicrobia bacterium CG_4_10_14_3_um_filter_43_23]PIY62937.1 MAG: 3-deoxy-D-manno-octulosonic acid transferase [Verrucomicrobia bacterium CG_4_10_14_0_8_um_filter_43_34]PJA43906.1 MAG: 3-deoxy-D-manno-octulosonic acid transfer
MIWLYRLLFFPVLLLSLPYYLKRMFKRGGYGKDFRYRFGFIKPKGKDNPKQKRVWIQAVSLGEMRAIKPFLEQLKDRGDIDVVLTTTTSTAYKLALEMYPNMVTEIGLFPLDFWLFSKIAWSRIQPDIVILMEGELWPEHLHQAHVRKIPVILMNARLSDRSFKRYKKLATFARFVIRQVDLILASNSQDRDRFIALGAASNKVHLTGNIKFDAAVVNPMPYSDRNILKSEMGFFHKKDLAQPLVIVGSSTWPGEEEALVLILKKALDIGVNCRLLLVPRHAERGNEIRQFLEKQDLSFHFRSDSKKAGKECFIYVGDTTGELSILTQVGDIIFIGKSLPPNIGGQTPIEAASLAMPIVFGSDMSNFRLFARDLLNEKGALSVKDAKELFLALFELIQDGHKRIVMGQNARTCFQKNEGAVKRTLNELEVYLKS